MDLSKILTEFPYTTELHAHTSPASHCGDFPPDEVVGFYRAKGVTSLAITNHLNNHYEDKDWHIDKRVERYLADYRLAKEAAGDDMNIILGVEIRFDENINDYLVFGVDESDIPHFYELLPYGIENFYKEVKNDKNVIIQAHPLRKNMAPIPFGSIDGIESMNMHPNHHARPSVAFKIAKENDLLVTGGSDYHHLGHEALCLMRTENELKDSFDVAKAIKSKNVVFDCSGHIIVPYLY